MNGGGSGCCPCLFDPEFGIWKDGCLASALGILQVPCCVCAILKSLLRAVVPNRATVEFESLVFDHRMLDFEGMVFDHAGVAFE